MIRPYSNNDKQELVNILRLNTPHYFDESEETDFIEYLDHYRERYFVYEEHNQIVGAAGINYFTDEGVARLSWDLIHPDFQGKGIGKKLTQYRINLLQNDPQIHMIVVRTTQLVYPFYEKLGFELEKTEKDFWAKGFDLYQMKMKLMD